MTSTAPREDVHADTDTVRFASSRERARRVAALRDGMEREDLAALIVCGRGDARFRGRVFYVSDVLEISGDTFVVLPLEGDPIFVTSPVVGLARARLTDWISDLRMSQYPGAEIGAALADLGLGRSDVGVVGLADALSVGHLRELESALPEARLRDATELFEEVRRVKSEEELANLRETSAIFRKVFAALEAEIRPGVQEGDLLAEATRLARIHGCRDVKAAMSKTPFRAVTYGSTRQIGREDIVMIWIESPGPSGYWLELRRCYSFGPPPEDVRRFWELQVEAAASGVDAMKPGARASDVMSAIEGVLMREGYDCGGPNATYSIHGIGTDAIEGMWFPGNDHVLREGEVVSLHPAVRFESESDARRLRFIGITDNVLVAKDGGVRLTYEADEFVGL